MNYSHLIPHDNLHWCEYEKRFVALRKKEYESIILEYYKSGNDIEETENLLKLIRWAEELKVGSILFKRLLKGELSVKIDPETKDIMFAARSENEQETAN